MPTLQVWSQKTVQFCLLGCLRTRLQNTARYSDNVRNSICWCQNAQLANLRHLSNIHRSLSRLSTIFVVLDRVFFVLLSPFFALVFLLFVPSFRKGSECFKQTTLGQSSTHGVPALCFRISSCSYESSFTGISVLLHSWTLWESLSVCLDYLSMNKCNRHVVVMSFWSNFINPTPPLYRIALHYSPIIEELQIYAGNLWHRYPAFLQASVPKEGPCLLSSILDGRAWRKRCPNCQLYRGLRWRRTFSGTRIYPLQWMSSEKQTVFLLSSLLPHPLTLLFRPCTLSILYELQPESALDSTCSGQPFSLKLIIHIHQILLEKMMRSQYYANFISPIQTLYK